MAYQVMDSRIQYNSNVLRLNPIYLHKKSVTKLNSIYEHEHKHAKVEFHA